MTDNGENLVAVVVNALPMGTPFSDGSTPEEVAQRILAALGLKPIGMVIASGGHLHDLNNHVRHPTEGPRTCADYGCHPVYRLGTEP